MASFIIGLPGETEETLQETIQFAMELDTTWGFNVLSPFPGTEVREKAAEYGIEILTNDWSKYDANRAVTRTEGAGPEEIADALNQYDRGLNRYVSDLEKQGKGKLIEAIQVKNSSPLACAILQEDVIENLGILELNENPVEDLAKQIAKILPYPHHQVSENIKKWVGEGLLKYNKKGDHLVWRWS